MPIGSCSDHTAAYDIFEEKETAAVCDEEMSDWVPVVRALARVVRDQGFDGESASRFLRHLLAQSDTEPSAAAFHFTGLFAHIDGSPDDVANALEQTALRLETGG